MTREELADELDCSAGAIVHWEGGKRAIPSWVADKMFSKLPITFTVQELSEMYELCREGAYTMSELIQESVRELIRVRREAKTPKATKNPQGAVGSNIVPLDKGAGEQPRPPRRKNGTED